jgi:predicted nucleic acid-binding protein
MVTKRALKATLDACIIFQIVACDTLLHIAGTNLYRPVWSNQIIEEVFKTSRAVLDTDSQNGLINRVSDMNRSFPNAHFDAPLELENLIKPFLQDPKDAHVIATALYSNSDLIVTENLKDFPEELLTPLGIQVFSFDSFMSFLFEEDAERVHQGLLSLTRNKTKPPISVLDHLLLLEKLSPNFNRLVRDRLLSQN